MAAALNPTLVRGTLKKVDKCVARLQELQYTVSGGRKIVSGVSLSPRSTRGYLRTSLRCKQETIRMKNATARRSPVGKFPEKPPAGQWRRMSLPGMLLGETVVEILRASQFAKEVFAAASRPSTNTANRRASSVTTLADPKTPVTVRRSNSHRAACEITELRARRTKEKQSLHCSARSESGSPPLRRARSRISFKAASPPNRRESSSYRHVVAAQRVSARHRPWAKKTVLFPNPIFSSPSSHQQQKFCKTGSPVIIGMARQDTAHKFLIKSPPTASELQLRVKNTPAVPQLSPTRQMGARPGMVAVTKLRRSFSPSRLANRLVSPLRSSVCRREGSSGRRSIV